MPNGLGSEAEWGRGSLAAHFAELLVLPTDFGAYSYACEVAILERGAIWQVLLVGAEALRIESANPYYFDEVILCRERASTCPTPAIKTDELNRLPQSLSGLTPRFKSKLGGCNLCIPRNVTTTYLPYYLEKRVSGIKLM
jgi:hypothetical protein